MKTIINIFASAMVFAMAVLALSVHNYFIAIPSLIALFIMGYKTIHDEIES